MAEMDDKQRESKPRRNALAGVCLAAASLFGGERELAAQNPAQPDTTTNAYRILSKDEPHSNSSPVSDSNPINEAAEVTVRKRLRTAYFCEHAHYAAHKTVGFTGDRIQKNHHRENLIGFLHIPGDDFTYQNEVNDRAAREIGKLALNYLGTSMSLPIWFKPDIPDLDQRHQEIEPVIGKALKGFIDDSLESGPEIDILLTGFDKNQSFGAGRTRVGNNPSGDFVRNRKNIDDALRAAYGDQITPGNTQGSTFEYLLMADSGPKRVRIHTAELPVDNGCIDENSPQSIQSLIKSVRPHAVLMLGVDTNDEQDRCIVESTVTDRFLEQDGETLTRPQNPRVRRENAFQSLALARALNVNDLSPQ